LERFDFGGGLLSVGHGLIHLACRGDVVGLQLLGALEIMFGIERGGGGLGEIGGGLTGQRVIGHGVNQREVLAIGEAGAEIHERFLQSRSAAGSGMCIERARARRVWSGCSLLPLSKANSHSNAWWLSTAAASCTHSIRFATSHALTTYLV